MSDDWHKHVNCPQCHSNVRHRLFFAALQHLNDLSFDRVFMSKQVLHFAPEKVVGSRIRTLSSHYVTADFLRKNCDLKIDMCDMAEIKSGSFDVVIAFDVLEHVPDYRRALREVHRVLSPDGFAILTVPQKDHLPVTFDDPHIVSPEERLKHFGQEDHLRIFGDDFADLVEGFGFSVKAVNESFFPEELIKQHVLAPPTLSTHPLATNYRKVFFSQKGTGPAATNHRMQ